MSLLCRLIGHKWSLRFAGYRPVKLCTRCGAIDGPAVQDQSE